jgi:hypothetical protein
MYGKAIQNTYWPECQKKYAFSLREKARMRGYESGRGALYDPLSPTLSLRQRGLIGRMADQSGFQP